MRKHPEDLAKSKCACETCYYYNKSWHGPVGKYKREIVCLKCRQVLLANGKRGEILE